MKFILFAAALIAASAGAAIAGEGGGDPFAQNLPAIGRTYVVGVVAQARPEAPVPAYARLLPSPGHMTIVQTPNSLPRGFSSQAPTRARPG